MLQSIEAYDYESVGQMDWSMFSAIPGAAPVEPSSLVQNSARTPDQRGDAELLVRRLALLIRSIPEMVIETGGRNSYLHALVPVELRGFGRITAGESLADRKEHATLDALVVLLTSSERTPPWLCESARSIREFTEFSDYSGSDEGPALTSSRAISGLRLLSELADVIKERPFVYPSAGDSLTIDLITRKGRLAIIHDARGNQLLHAKPEGVSSAIYSSGDQALNAIRNAVQEFYEG